MQAISDGIYKYSVCVAEPGSFPIDKEPDGLADQQAIEIEPLPLLT
jgi:hypothetical protein